MNQGYVGHVVQVTGALSIFWSWRLMPGLPAASRAAAGSPNDRWEQEGMDRNHRAMGTDWVYLHMSEPAQCDTLQNIRMIYEVERGPDWSLLTGSDTIEAPPSA